jgi:hypothetical protein
VIAAMNVVANIDIASLGNGGGGVKIGTDNNGGDWRGRDRAHSGPRWQHGTSPGRVPNMDCDGVSSVNDAA